jgi:Lsr2
MAQKIQTLFIDDLDGSEAEGTVRFGLDGTEYEIDLNAKHAQELRNALARYIAAGPRGGTAAVPRRPPRDGERAEYHRGPRMGQGPGHRGEGPRPGASPMPFSLS